MNGCGMSWLAGLLSVLEQLPPEKLDELLADPTRLFPTIALPSPEEQSRANAKLAADLAEIERRERERLSR